MLIATPLLAAVICPLSATTCCGPPVAGAPGCCAGSTCTATLTIFSSPDPSREGRAVTVSGSLSTGLNDVRIVPWRELAGQQRFHRLAQTTTTARGRYAFTLHPQINQQLYVTVNQQGSTRIAQDVYARVTLRARRRSRRLTLAGAVTPAHPGELIQLQALVGGRWQTWPGRGCTAARAPRASAR